MMSIKSQSPEKWQIGGNLLRFIKTQVIRNEMKLIPEELNHNRIQKILFICFTFYAILQITIVIYLWFNHINFPLNLEAMELTILTHLKRVMSGLVLYPEPSSAFIPLAYNPLYYYLSVPFAWILGANLFTLRLVSIIGAFGSGFIIFSAIYKRTNSLWWGLMAVWLKVLSGCRLRAALPGSISAP